MLGTVLPPILEALALQYLPTEQLFKYHSDHADTRPYVNEALAEHVKLLKELGVRLIDGPDAYYVLKETIKEQQREKKFLLENKEVQKNSKDELQSDDFSVEKMKFDTLVSLDMMLDTINFKLVEDWATPNFCLYDSVYEMDFICGLTRIPVKLINMLENNRYLTAISFDNNHLTFLPEELVNLKLLECLDLRNNKLIRLPNSFCSMTQLRQFRACNNQLRELPEEFGDLSRLTLLEISNNKLTTLPTSLSKLIGLKAFDVSENPLKTLPGSLKLIINCFHERIYSQLLRSESLEASKETSSVNITSSTLKTRFQAEQISEQEALTSNESNSETETNILMACSLKPEFLIGFHNFRISHNTNVSNSNTDKAKSTPYLEKTRDGELETPKPKPMSFHLSPCSIS